MNVDELKRLKFHLRLAENPYFHELVEGNDSIDIGIRPLSKFSCINFYWKYDLSKSIFIAAKRIDKSHDYANVIFFECDKNKLTKVPREISKLKEIGLCNSDEFEIFFNWIRRYNNK